MQRRKLIQLLGAWAGALPLLNSATAAEKTTRSRSLIVLDSRIAGFAYYEGGASLPNIKTGDALALRREPQNAHDHRAVEIYWNEKKLGYVPRSHNRALYKLMDAGETIVGEVKRVDVEDWEPLYFTASVVV